MPLMVNSLAEWLEQRQELLSIVIPAHNEEKVIRGTIYELYNTLKEANVTHEILVVNDCSTDGTEGILQSLILEIPTLRYVNNCPPHGFGFAIRYGLSLFRGEAVAIFMADSSDDPKDLVNYYREYKKGYDCVFGSRFMKGAKVYDYPWIKFILNRLGNNFIRLLFWMRYDDTTNAFKLFGRHVIAGVQPILSSHFNLTVELPLKAIVRGYSYTVVPSCWTNRKEGVSKFKIREIGSRYLFIVFYCLIEKLFSRGDYKPAKTDQQLKLQVWPH